MAKSHSSFDCLASLYLDGSRNGGMFLPMSSKMPVVKDVALTGVDSGQPFIFGVLNLTGLSFFYVFFCFWCSGF